MQLPLELLFGFNQHVSLYFFRQKRKVTLTNCELWLNKILLATKHNNSLVAEN